MIRLRNKDSKKELERRTAWSHGRSASAHPLSRFWSDRGPFMHTPPQTRDEGLVMPKPVFCPNFRATEDFLTPTLPLPPRNARQRARSALHLNFREGEGLFTHPLLKPCSNRETEVVQKRMDFIGDGSCAPAKSQCNSHEVLAMRRQRRGKALWGLYFTNPFDQSGGMTLLAEKLPRARFEFVGRTPPQQYQLTGVFCLAVVATNPDFGGY